MAEGLYRIGGESPTSDIIISKTRYPFVLIECIYMEVYPPPMPYQICKIEELRKVYIYPTTPQVVDTSYTDTTIFTSSSSEHKGKCGSCSKMLLS